MARKVVLCFDIPRGKASLRVKVWRELKKLGAELGMGSYWSLPHNKRNLADFKKLARDVVKGGGTASVIAGDVIRITKPRRR